MREQIIKKADEILKQAQEETYETYYGTATVDRSLNGMTISMDFDEGAEEALEEGYVRDPYNTELNFFSHSNVGFIGNGWSFLSPEEIGALVDEEAIILGYGSDYDDDGNLIGVEHVYFYSSYQTGSFIEDLLETGRTFFEKVE